MTISGEATVRRFWKSCLEEPQLILELGLFEMVGRAKDEEYRCLVCEERVVTRIEMQRHVLGHYLDHPWVIKILPKGRKRSSKKSSQVG